MRSGMEDGNRMKIACGEGGGFLEETLCGRFVKDLVDLIGSTYMFTETRLHFENIIGLFGHYVRCIGKEIDGL